MIMNEFMNYDFVIDKITFDFFIVNKDFTWCYIFFFK